MQVGCLYTHNLSTKPNRGISATGVIGSKGSKDHDLNAGQWPPPRLCYTPHTRVLALNSSSPLSAFLTRRRMCAWDKNGVFLGDCTMLGVLFCFGPAFTQH
ncbi:uncharacterized protein BDR25DRAFT_90143 [Lindgomyces ingoldianus]|uniref:Uncharacterized protein n=1 Tax=Lindgomyces ingoldianus TaxID=673940 RepID=A0ACB6RAG8_9PLEO|nr:uncharacterized protein BDR25DRAFT_90143 [Lindgomyces ingoldianus]KAF2476055.1 hypothetical protein BDR25DRAFT_90143 [Lindgomyces ingoldianus]